MEKEDGAGDYAASLKFIKVILPSTYLTVFLLLRVHIQAWMQLLKEVSRTKLQSFPLHLSHCHDLPSLSFVLHYQRQYVEWMLISASSVEKCISVKKPSTLNTDLRSVLQNISNFAAWYTRYILSNIRSSRSQEFCREHWEIF